MVNDKLDRRVHENRRYQHSAHRVSYIHADRNRIRVGFDRRVLDDRRMVDDRRKASQVMRIKYVIRPGLIQGSDGHSYEFDADSLIRLYQVRSSECVVLHNSDRQFDAKYSRYISLGYIFLYPRSNGKYSWFKKKYESSDSQSVVNDKT